MIRIPTTRTDLAAIALALGTAGLAGCGPQRFYAPEDTPPPPAGEAPIVAPAPFWPPAPPVGTPVREIGTWDRLGFLVGYVQRDSSWDPFQDQVSFRFTGTHEWRKAPVGVEWSAGWAGASKDIAGVDTTNQNFELSVGPTRTFHLGGGRWFTNLGLGLAWTYTEAGENTGFQGVAGEADGWFAGYGHVSLIYRILPGWDLALDLRAAKGEDVELGNVSIDGQYWQASFGFGVGI